MAGELQKRFGRLVAAHRKRCGLTQEKLAEQAGISIDTVRKIETGASGASFPMIEKIAFALDLDPAELFGATISSGRVNNGKLQQLSVRLIGLTEREIAWISDLVELALKSPK